MSSSDLNSASKWVTNSNEAVLIRLFSSEDKAAIEKYLENKVTNDSVVEKGENNYQQQEQDGEYEDIDIIEFHPTFTYTIYGDLESIFGYTGLQIKLNISAGSLKTYLNVSYEKKVDGLESISSVSLKSDDVVTPITKYLSNDLLTTNEAFVNAVLDDSKKFKPLGKKVYEYKNESDEESIFEIYENKLDNEPFRRYYRRFRMFILFYIEGGTYIDEEDSRWTIFTLYKKQIINNKPIYSFAGFCSMYNFYHFPDKVRARISQFLILPPYQNVGHGSKLYSYIRESVISNDEIVDFTVEDPSESFDDMRDKSDIRWCIQNKVLEKVCAPPSNQEIRNLRSKYKLSQRQMLRVCELIILKNLNKKSYHKQRCEAMPSG